MVIVRKDWPKMVLARLRLGAGIIQGREFLRGGAWCIFLKSAKIAFE